MKKEKQKEIIIIREAYGLIFSIVAKTGRASCRERV